MTQLGSSAPEAAAPGRLGRKRDHSRDPEILDAAIDVLAEVGFDGMTVDMVAARARAGKATLYRRWTSKSELVIEAVSCMKDRGNDPAALPDTGTLRGDLVAMIKPHSIEDGEKKTRVMAGIVSLLAKEPELAQAASAAIMEPRARINRVLLQRAVDRGEIAPVGDIDTLAMVMPAMVAYRVLMQRRPVDREYLVSLIDGVLLPAVGLGRSEDLPGAG
jgi:AcrR family transcriptional regulator